MLKQFARQWTEQRGDTLIEVTFALSILGVVLLGSTAIAATAFRMGQTARERTTVAEDAQEQMEALRSFRDNHSWDEFRAGNPPTYLGVNGAMSQLCKHDDTKRCFHMELQTAGGVREWVPKAGSKVSAVPTSYIEITTTSPGIVTDCGYDFELRYAFTSLGGAKASNKIKTRIVNLKYVPGVGGAACL